MFVVISCQDILCRVPTKTIIFDVSQQLEEIRASWDVVKSTTIALAKVYSTFISGTTIGATQWVAYMMTKGGPAPPLG